jgi:hypothetical protein
MADNAEQRPASCSRLLDGDRAWTAYRTSERTAGWLEKPTLKQGKSKESEQPPKVNTEDEHCSFSPMYLRVGFVEELVPGSDIADQACCEKGKNPSIDQALLAKEANAV